jgi:hypothetical protein
MSFSEIADQRLLGSVTSQLGELTWDVDPDGYQRLRVPPDVDVDVLLRLLLRRGLEPALASLLLDRFASRPVECALIAWDVVAGALLGTGDAALAQRLRASLAPLKPIGASTSAAVPRDHVAALIASVATIGDRAMPEGSATLPSLAAVAALTASDTAGIDAALAAAERLALAHLPSLALAFAQILWTRLALPQALDRLIEIGLDFERFDSIPPMTEQDGRSLERQTYFGLRVALAQLDTRSAANILAQMSMHPAVASSSDPALAIASIELDLLNDKPVDYALIERIAALAPNLSTWRYASRVDCAVKLQLGPELAAPWVDGFLTSFGNDLRVWAQAGAQPQARAELLALVSRELRYQSFDPEAWRALAVFLDDGTPIELALQERSMTQLAAALA